MIQHKWQEGIQLRDSDVLSAMLSFIPYILSLLLSAGNYLIIIKTV